MNAGLVVLAALLGLTVGSFLNVVISRLPRGESLLWPGSHCPNCRRKLLLWENVPVVSYLFLRGKCRTCHSPIGVRHVIVEAAAGAAAALAAGLALRGGVRG